MVGRLFGLDPAPAQRARVLELGCGDGGNLLSLGQALPGASFLGIDAAASGIERGTGLARAAGLSNVQLRCASFEQLKSEPALLGSRAGARELDSPVAGEQERVGEFDYILAHGVYSWVPPQARRALLDAIRRHLAPRGIAYVSYNAYPGSYLRDMARDILGYHVRGIEDPHERLAAAQELMRTIVAIEEPSPYASVLREHMERMLRYSDALLFHDDLADIATPFYLYEFAEHASKHGLAFLAEAELSESQMRDVPESAARLMQELPDDAVVREQYLDFFKNRMFRQTLLCHAEAPVSRELDETQVEGFFALAQLRPAPERHEAESEGGGKSGGGRGFDGSGREAESGDRSGSLEQETFATPEGYTVTTSEPLVRAALHALAEAWPEPLPFVRLLAAAREAAGADVPGEMVRVRLRTVLVQAYLGRIVQLLGCAASLSAAPGERPLASPLACAQHAAGLPVVSSLLHANARLEGDLEPRLLGLLDGSRTTEELARELEAPTADVAAALERFASVGLLAG